MKITTDRRELATALGWVASIVPRNPNPPVLAAIRLDAKDGKLKIGAFDMDTYHEARIDCEVETAGTVLAPGIVLRDVVSAAVAPFVTLDYTDRTKLKVKAGRASYALATTPIEDAIPPPKISGSVGSLNAEVLAELVDSVIHCVDPQSARHVLRGVRLTGRDGALTIEGAQSARAARVSCEWKGKDLDMLPDGRQLAASLRGMAGTAKIGVLGNGNLSLATADRTVIMRTLAEAYPNLSTLYRTGNDDPFIVECDGSELAGAVKRLRAVGSGELPMVTLSADTEGILLTLPGEHSGEEFVEGKASQPITATFKAEYLGEALPAGQVKITFARDSFPNSAAVHDPERPALQQMIMPLKPKDG